MAGPGPKTAGVRLVNTYFKKYRAEIIRLLTKQRESASESDDAAALVGGLNSTELLRPARDALASHIADKNNPHQETMVSLGSYTEATVTNEARNKVPNGVLPISTYGVFDGLDDAGVAALWTFSGWKLSCNKAMNVILSGTPYVLPPTTIDLSAVDNPANKIFYIYVRTQFGLISYQARTDSPPESSGVMYIGKAVCNASEIASRTMMAVTRIDTFRLSSEPIGSAIPVTKGTFDAVTKLPTTWKPL